MIVNIYFMTSNYVVCCIKVCCIQVLLYSNIYVKVFSSLLLNKKSYVIVELEMKKVINNFFPFIWTSKKRRKRKL